MTTLEQIEDYIRRREFVDYIMPIWLPFLPLLMIVFGGLLLILTIPLPNRYYYTYYDDIMHEALIAYFLIIYIVAIAINIYIVYKWVDRRNEHFKRQRLLFRSITDYLKSKGFEVGKLESINMETEVEENEKNAILWALIQFVPYVGVFLLLYVFHFLNKDFWKHERMEDQFLSAVSSILAAYGINFTYSRMYSIPNRNTFVYIVLLLVTLGLFSFYWVYTLTKDPNNHFVEHRRWEDTLLNALKSL